MQLPRARLNIILAVVLYGDLGQAWELQNVAADDDVQQKNAIWVQPSGCVCHAQDLPCCKFHLGFSLKDCIGECEAIHRPSNFLCSGPVDGV